MQLVEHRLTQGRIGMTEDVDVGPSLKTRCTSSRLIVGRLRGIEDCIHMVDLLSDVGLATLATLVFSGSRGKN